MIRVKTARARRVVAKEDRVSSSVRFKNVRAKMGRAFLSSLAVGSLFLCDRICFGWRLVSGRGTDSGRKDARESQMEAVKISGDECDFCWSRCRRYAPCIRGFAPSFLSFSFYCGRGIVSRLLKHLCRGTFVLRYNSLSETIFYSS